MRLLYALSILFSLAWVTVQGQEKNIRINELNSQRIQDIKADTGSISAYIRLASKLRSKSPDSAIRILQTTLSLSRDMHDDYNIARSLNVMGLAYIMKENYDQAINFFSEAAQYAQKTDHSQLLFEIYNNLSVPYNVKGDYMTGINFLYKAVNVAEHNIIRDTDELANFYCNLGGELLSVGENDKAWYYLKKAQSYALKTKDVDVQARIITDMAGVYYQKNILDSALPLYLQSLDISKRLGNTGAQKVTLENIGKLYIKQKQPAKGIEYLNRALDINTNSVTDDIMIYYDLGNAYYQMKNYKKAEDILLSVEKLAEKSGVKSHLTDAYLILAGIYAETGRYKQAYEQQRAYSTLYESVLNESSARQFSQEETKYQTAEKDKDIAQKQLLLSRQESKLKEKNILIVSISAIFILLAGLSLILYRSIRHKRKVEQLKAIMEGEEKERKRIARDLHDGISQTISAAKINLMAIEKEIHFSSEEQKQKFDKIIGMVDEGFKEVRTISHNMMPNALLESGLSLVIKQFVDNIDRNVIKISLHTQGLDEHFDSAIETILYRVIQECVSNVIKHAKATQLDIALIKDNDGISATIEDNGVGFNISNMSSFSGIGLRNMRSRIALLQGKIEFDSSPQNGTLVSIYIPAEK